MSFSIIWQYFIGKVLVTCKFGMCFFVCYLTNKIILYNDGKLYNVNKYIFLKSLALKFYKNS